MHYSLDEISQVAKEVIAGARRRRAPDHATLITFSGDLGAGKTTLIQEIARQLGITEPLQSPTYVIYKKYAVDGSSWRFLIHGDMYRLESEQEIENLGWEELIADPQNILCIEWPEKIAAAIPSWAIRVVIHHVGGNHRRIEL